VSVGPKPRSLADRFWEKVDVRGPDECWEWTAARHLQGYGRFWIGSHAEGKTHRAHRVAWELENGPVPDGLDVCHHCDNPPCCNPRHLWLGTNQDNLRDCSAKGRAYKPTWWGEQVGSSKLTLEQVREIRRMAHLGLTRREIAACFGVAKTTVTNIINGETWRAAA
jgi:hypothetical protein